MQTSKGTSQHIFMFFGSMLVNLFGFPIKTTSSFLIVCFEHYPFNIPRVFCCFSSFLSNGERSRVYLVWNVHAKETNHLSGLRLMLDGWIEHELVVSTQLKMLCSQNGSFF